MRVIIADDQAIVRYALQIWLSRQPSVEIVGEATNADDLALQIELTSPDLVLLDWELPGGGGIRLLSKIRSIAPQIYVIALSGRLEACHAALSAGVNQFISKVEPPENLMAAISEFLELYPV